jgi:hypothetical protein
MTFVLSSQPRAEAIHLVTDFCELLKSNLRLTHERWRSHAVERDDQIDHDQLCNISNLLILR